MTARAEAYRNAALAKGKQRRAEKAAFREELFSALRNLPTDNTAILRLMGVVRAGKLKGWVSVGGGRSIERTLRIVAQSLKAADFYAFRLEAGERTKRSPQKPRSLAEQRAEEQSRMLDLEELKAKARLYAEEEESEEDA